MEKINIGLIAPLTSYSGYGQYGRAIALMLQDLYKDSDNVKLFIYNSSTNLPKQQIFDIQNSKYTGLTFSNLQTIQTTYFTTFMTVSVPQSFLKKGLFNIGITALAQTDKVHPNLIQKCNQMDEVWVMSQYNVETINVSRFTLKDNQKLQMTKPVKILQHPFLYNLNQIKPVVELTSQITQFINDIQQDKLFLSVGQWLPGNLGSDRKDIGMLCLTFLKRYANSKQYGLLLKVDSGKSSLLSQYSIRQKLNQIYKTLNIQCKINNIYFISGNLKQYQMHQIYAHNKVKAYVSFSHGQSFGIPIMQFSGLTGKPLLVPYHSGLTQYVNPQFCQILIHKPTNVSQQLFNTFYRQFLLPQSKWFTVDYQYALFKFGDLMETYSKKQDRHKQQQQHIIKTLNKEKIQKQLETYLTRFIYPQQE